MLEILGKGASSLVRKALHRPSSTMLAVKILNVFDKGKRDQLLRELRTNPEARVMAGKFTGLKKFVKIANRTKRRKSQLQVASGVHEAHGQRTQSRLRARRASLQGRLDLHLEREASRRAAAAASVEGRAQVKGPPAFAQTHNT